MSELLKINPHEREGSSSGHKGDAGSLEAEPRVTEAMTTTTLPGISLGASSLSREIDYANLWAVTTFVSSAGNPKRFTGGNFLGEFSRKIFMIRGDYVVNKHHFFGGISMGMYVHIYPINP